MQGVAAQRGERLGDGDKGRIGQAWGDWLVGLLPLRAPFGELPVNLRHAVGVAELPTHHSDPSDRLLVAQAASENLAILTAAPLVMRYPVQTIS